MFLNGFGIRRRFAVIAKLVRWSSASPPETLWYGAEAASSFLLVMVVLPYNFGMLLGCGCYEFGCLGGVGGDALFEFSVVCLARAKCPGMAQV